MIDYFLLITVLRILIQKELISHNECKQSFVNEKWSVGLFCLQCAKSPDVVLQTADVLKDHDLLKEAEHLLGE